MAKKKLTNELREEIKRNYRKFNEKNLDKDAVTYLHRVQGAAKARKIKKNLYVEVADIKLKKGSIVYDKFEKEYAASKGLTVKEFLQKYPKASREHLRDFKAPFTSHSDKSIKLLNDLKKKHKVYNNGQETTVSEMVKDISLFRKKYMSFSYYDYSSHEVATDYFGNLYFKLPTAGETLRMDNEQELIYIVKNNYPNITLHKDERKTTVDDDGDEDDELDEDDFDDE